MKKKEICQKCGEEKKEDCMCNMQTDNVNSGGCCGGNCGCGH